MLRFRYGSSGNQFPALFMPSWLGIGLVMLFLQGCSVHYNTFFNAEKAYNQALKLRAERLRLNPEDSVAVSPEERTKLIRAVTKSSKVLELWPNDAEYAPKAVFLIAESQLLMEDFASAALKYEEYIRFFPTQPNIPMAKVRRAQALHRDGKTLAAREALDEVMATNPRGEVRREALLLAARLRIDEQSGVEGLALYEQLLNEGAFPSPEGRNEARWRAAVIAYQVGEWEKARAFALAAGEGVVPASTRFRNHRLGILALYELGRHAEGLSEIRDLQDQREYRPFRPELKLLEGRGEEARGDWATASSFYREAVRLGPRTPAAAEAWYRLGARLLDVDNNEHLARPLFDSAAAVGRGFEYGAKGAEAAEALARLAELRKPDTTRSDSAQPHYRAFMMAEIFHFLLAKPDSTRLYLRRIAADTVEDTAYTRRALYALAYIEETLFLEDGGKARADSLYRALLARYPATEWAKQAERNLGLPPTVRTPDDLARAAFLEAERMRLASGDLNASVMPAYRAVAEAYPASLDAAQALFVIAFLTEQEALAGTRDQEAIDSVKEAFRVVRDKYPATLFADAASARLNALETGTDEGGRRQDSGEHPVSDEEGSGDDASSGDAPTVPRREQLDPSEDQDLY